MVAYRISEELSASQEDYLKAILEAESEGREVVPAMISEWLEVSPPAVSKAIRRLRENGYVASTDSPVHLTDRGRQIAHQTAFRHYLVERMLGEIFGMEWHQIHTEAERLEHAISPAFEAKLIEKLGAQAACPHGNYVLPEPPAQLRSRGLVPLWEGAAGHNYRVVSMYERDRRLLDFLHTRGISPRAELHLREHLYDETVELRMGSRDIILGRPAAERIFVELLQ